MKLGKLSVIGVGLLLLVVALLIYTQDLGTEDKSYDPSQLSKEDWDVLLNEVNDFQEFLAKKGGFYEQVVVEMENEGYDYSINGMIYSKDDIRLSILIPNKVVVTEQEQEKVTKIIKDLIIKNNLDPKAFNIEVTQGGG